MGGAHDGASKEEEARLLAKKKSERRRQFHKARPPLLFTAGVTKNQTHVIQVWDLKDGGKAMSCLGLNGGGHSSRITSLAFGPFNNGPLVSASIDGTIKVWDHKLRRPHRTLLGSAVQSGDSALDMDPDNLPGESLTVERGGVLLVRKRWKRKRKKKR